MENTNSEWLSADNHFTIIPNWVYDLGLSSQAFHLYACLMKYADNTTRQSFPSRARLAADIGASTKTVDRKMKELVEAKALTVTHRKRSGTMENQVNLYTLHTVKPQEVGTPVSPPRDMDVATWGHQCRGELYPLNYTTELDPLLDDPGPSPTWRGMLKLSPFWRDVAHCQCRIIDLHTTV